MDPLKLMCVFAHPDDESLGVGGTLAKYGSEDVETYLLTATRGERGWTGAAEDYPGPEALGKIREAELRAAASALGVREVALLDYMDGDIDKADPQTIIARIVAHLRRVRPQVVITFDPNGSYGHPDHIAICQFTTAAVVAAADPAYPREHGLPAHRVSKLYYLVDTVELWDLYQAHFGDLAMQVDGTERRMIYWPDWAITTRIDASAYWRQAWGAVSSHRSQLPNYDHLSRLPEEIHKQMWGAQTFYRAYSLVNGGREVESDLFEGLREHEQE